MKRPIIKDIFISRPIKQWTYLPFYKCFGFIYFPAKKRIIDLKNI